jgi:parvulin-like peptidyl-prolyl isomerase
MIRNYKHVVVFILILAMTFTFTACGGDKNESDGGDILATVKDTEITDKQVDGYSSYYSLLSLSTPKSQLQEEEQTYLKGIMLNFAVEVEVLKQHFEAEGTEVLPDDYDDQFEKYKETLKSQGESIDEQLKEEGIGDETLEFFFAAQFYTQKYMDGIDNETPVTDADIKTYYEENKDQLVSPSQIKVSHILVEDDKHSDAGRTSIEAIKADIDSGEATFAEMAKKYNTDATKDTGGDLGWMDANSNFVQEFKDAALALKEVNEMSDVVETQFGYHLILLTDKKKEHQKTLKEATADIKATLEEQNYAAGIEALKNEMKVKYTKAGNKALGVDTGTGTGDGTTSGGATTTTDGAAKNTSGGATE